MDEHQGLTLPALDIMKSHPIHAQEATYRWVFPLGVTGLLDRIESRRAQRGGGAKKRRGEPAAPVEARGAANRLRLPALKLWAE